MTRLNWFQKLVAGDTIDDIVYDRTIVLRQELDIRNSQIATLMEIVDKSEGLVEEVKRLKAIINEYTNTNS